MHAQPAPLRSRTLGVLPQVRVPVRWCLRATPGFRKGSKAVPESRPVTSPTTRGAVLAVVAVARSPSETPSHGSQLAAQQRHVATSGARGAAERGRIPLPAAVRHGILRSCLADRRPIWIHLRQSAGGSVQLAAWTTLAPSRLKCWMSLRVAEAVDLGLEASAELGVGDAQS